MLHALSRGCRIGGRACGPAPDAHAFLPDLSFQCVPCGSELVIPKITVGRKTVGRKTVARATGIVRRVSHSLGELGEQQLGALVTTFRCVVAQFSSRRDHACLPGFAVVGRFDDNAALKTTEYRLSKNRELSRSLVSLRINEMVAEGGGAVDGFALGRGRWRGRLGNRYCRRRCAGGPVVDRFELLRQLGRQRGNLHVWR